MTPRDPVAEAVEALRRALAAGTLLAAHYEASQALAALSRLHTRRKWPCNCMRWVDEKGVVRRHRCDIHWQSDGPLETERYEVRGYLLYDEPTP